MGDGVTARELFPDIHLIPGLEKIDGYTGLRNAIAEHFKVTPKRNYFEFAYDWRRDNRVSARRLKTLAESWLSNWRHEKGNNEPKMVLICHSMGGLIARYFLEVLDGWRNTRALITFGTPYRGSVKALDYVSNGYSVGSISLDSVTELFRSFTSIYQLLPIYECCYGTAPNPVELTAFPGAIANVDIKRANEALKLHDEMRAAAEKNRLNPEYLNGRYDFAPVIGIGEPTASTVKVSAGSLVVNEVDGDRGGDGTVSRESADPPKGEQESAAHYVHGFHGSLQNSVYSWWQLAGILKGPYPVPGEKKYLYWDDEKVVSEFLKYSAPPPTDVAVGLRIRDAYTRSTPIAVQLRRGQNVETELQLTIETEESHTVFEKTIAAKNEGQWYDFSLVSLPPNSYRIRVNAHNQPRGFPQELNAAVSDVFLVI